MDMLQGVLSGRIPISGQQVGLPCGPPPPPSNSVPPQNGVGLTQPGISGNAGGTSSAQSSVAGATPALSDPSRARSPVMASQVVAGLEPFAGGDERVFASFVTEFEDRVRQSGLPNEEKSVALQMVLKGAPKVYADQLRQGNQGNPLNYDELVRKLRESFVRTYSLTHYRQAAMNRAWRRSEETVDEFVEAVRADVVKGWPDAPVNWDDTLKQRVLENLPDTMRIVAASSPILAA